MSVLDRPIDQYQEPGKHAAAALAIAMHALLAAALFFGVKWQNREPEAVSVELWTAPPAPPPVMQPEPKPVPRPQPKVEPKAEPKPLPRVEPKPDIALEKARQERERKRREEEEASLKREHDRKIKEAEAVRQRKLEEDKKAEAQKRLAEDKRRNEEDRRKRMSEELNRELGGARVAGPTPSPGAFIADRAAYAAKITAKIRPNVVLPSDLVGNPQAEFDVEQLPSGEVIAVKLTKSSGSRSYDEALERAILKSSPLPKPDRPEQFIRNLALKFRPKD